MRHWRTVVVLFVVIALVLIGDSISTRWLQHRKDLFNQLLDNLRQLGVTATIRSKEPDWIRPFKKYLPERVIEIFLVKECSVTLTGDKVTKQSLSSLRQLPKVTALIFTDTPNIDDDSLAALTELYSLEHLWVNGTRLSGVGFVHLQALPNLQSILFDNNALTEKGIEQLVSMKPTIQAFDVVLDSVKANGFELTGQDGSKSIKVGDLITVRGSFFSNHFVPKDVNVIVYRMQLREVEGGATSDLMEFSGIPTTDEKQGYRFNITSKEGIQYPGKYRVEVDFYIPKRNSGQPAVGVTLGSSEFEVK